MKVLQKTKISSKKLMVLSKSLPTVANFTYYQLAHKINVIVEQIKNLEEKN